MGSELFGHVKGAFTGAHESTPGLIRSADGGTLFMDEVGELSLAMQVKMLRTIQEKEVRPVGSSRQFTVDVRILAATNRDLEQEVAENRFRQDLYYRLNVVVITVAAPAQAPGGYRPAGALFPGSIPDTGVSGSTHLRSGHDLSDRL